MVDPVSPAGPAGLSAAGEDAGRAVGPSTALTPVGPVKTHSAKPAASTGAGEAAFNAQMMGQSGRKRGLKGGAPVLDEAKAAYLETEWSGSADRRLPAGKMTKADI